MFVKKVRKKCRVRGCNNVSDVYVISNRKEMSNTLIMCRECMKEAFESTEPKIEKEVTTSTVGDFTEEVETNASTETITDEVSNTSTSAEGVVTSAETTKEPKPIAAPKKPMPKSNKKPVKKK